MMKLTLEAHRFSIGNAPKYHVQGAGCAVCKSGTSIGEMPSEKVAKRRRI